MFEGLSAMVVAYAGRALMAVVILLVGVKLINRFTEVVDARLGKVEVEATLRSFVRSADGCAFVQGRLGDAS